MANGNFGGGNGTSGSPYLVEDADDLNAVRNNLTAYYKQTANIDLNIFPYNTGSGWLPIGDNTTKFTGLFNGYGYNITNCYIDRVTSYNGIFGYADEAVLTKIKVTNILIERTGDYAGGIVGRITGETSNISECRAEGIVNNLNSTSSYLGGIVGHITKTNAPSVNLTFEGIIRGVSYLGGIAGYAEFSIQDSYSLGSLISTLGFWVGGLVGYAPGTSSNIIGLIRCYSACEVKSSANATGVGGIGGLVGFANRCNIEESYAIGNATNTGGSAGQETGGLVGYIQDSSIIKCYATGNASNTGTRGVGGLVGSNNTTSISKSYARGSAFRGNHASVTGGCGGLVGLANSTATIINQCYSTGSAIGGNTITDVGGLIGLRINNASSVNSVWDIESSGNATSQGGIGKTTTQMKTKQTFIDLGWSI